MKKIVLPTLVEVSTPSVERKTLWKTSLLPYGDGTHFIALSAKVRKAENIKLGDTIKMSFQLRDRYSR